MTAVTFISSRTGNWSTSVWSGISSLPGPDDQATIPMGKFLVIDINATANTLTVTFSVLEDQFGGLTLSGPGAALNLNSSSFNESASATLTAGAINVSNSNVDINGSVVLSSGGTLNELGASSFIVNAGGQSRVARSMLWAANSPLSTAALFQAQRSTSPAA